MVFTAAAVVVHGCREPGVGYLFHGPWERKFDIEDGGWIAGMVFTPFAPGALPWGGMLMHSSVLARN
jgi:hypothetical protein